MATIAEYVAEAVASVTPSIADAKVGDLLDASRRRDLRVAAIAITRIVDLVLLQEEDPAEAALILREVALAIDRRSRDPAWLVRDPP
jgi:hypothetical protein